METTQTNNAIAADLVASLDFTPVIDTAEAGTVYDRFLPVHVLDNPSVECANDEDFDPAFPNHGTQAARLLAVSLLGQKINPLHGWRHLGIYRLSDAKHRLKKKMGWPMESGRLDVQNRFGEDCHVALYGLPEWAIEQAGERGQDFARREMDLMAVGRSN